MRVFFINNDGGGFSDHIEIAAGTSVAELFRQRMGDGRAEDYFICVNRQSASIDKILQEGDRISFVPSKIAGASFAD